MPPQPEQAALPRRDLILIPLIAVVTALLMFAVAEAVARRFFAERQEGNCGRPDPILPYRYAPNCSFKNKAAEGPLVSYSFNECGYRTPETCGPRPTGHLRLVLLGASTAMGFKAPFEDSLAAQAGKLLTAACKRPVELQNFGVAGYKLIDQYVRMNEALALKPDLIVRVLTPYELVTVTSPGVDGLARSARAPDQEGGCATAPSRQRAVARYRDPVPTAAPLSAAQYLLFQKRDPYIQLFLKHGDKADYLREPLPPAWVKRLSDVDVLVGGHGQPCARARGAVRHRLHAAAHPGCAQRSGGTAARNRPSVAGTGTAAACTCPRHCVCRRGRGLSRHPSSSEQLFFPVDGHMTAEGHHVGGSAMARGLVAARARAPWVNAKAPCR